MSYKNYFLHLKKYLVFAAFFFLLSVGYGYFMAYFSPEEIKTVVAELQKTYQPIMEKSVLEQVALVFLNNALVAFLTLGLSFIFGIFSVLVLFSNGVILGILGFLSFEKVSVSTFFVSILPHGIIELPVLIIFTAMGLRIGHTAIHRLMQKVFPKNIQLIAKEADIRKELYYAFHFFLKILLPFLLLASVIEIFITGAIV